MSLSLGDSDFSYVCLYLLSVNSSIASHCVQQPSRTLCQNFNEMVTSTYSKLSGPYGVELLYMNSIAGIEPSARVQLTGERAAW
jgi:hypothetical protein